MAAVSNVGLEIVQEDANHAYRWGNLIVAPKPTEQMLALFYLRMEQDKRLDLVFHSGVPRLSWFLDKYQEIDTVGCYENTELGIQLRGMGWFNGTTEIGNYRKSEAGEAFVKGVKPTNTLRFCQMMLAWAFNQLDADVIHGATPVPNRAACLFMQRLGFEHATIGGYFSWRGSLCSAEISWMTKERWAAICPFIVEKG